MAGRKNATSVKETMRILMDIRFLIFSIPFLLLYFFTAHNALFWDTVQFGAYVPRWYFDNNFKFPVLPLVYDSGHPPTFGIYLAVLWKIFGMSMFVSHTVMLPFIALLIAQAVKLGDNLFPKNRKYAIICTAIVLSEAVVLAQCTLVSPDIWGAAFFLYGLNAILKRANGHLTIAVIVLSLFSMRAMTGAFCLYLFSLSFNRNDVVLLKTNVVSYIFKKVLPFIPGGFIAICFFVAHYYATGWAGHPPEDSPWGHAFTIVPNQRKLVHLFILFWRIVDIGKILTVAIFFFFLCRWIFQKNISNNTQQSITIQSFFVLVLALFFITALPLIVYEGLLTHRYFMPLYTAIAVLAIYCLLISDYKRKVTIALLAIVVQLSGHFWNYPIQISQGWDSTLGHLPYYSMRDDFKNYMEKEGIPKTDVSTSSHLFTADYFFDLGTDTTTYKDFTQDTTAYVWYSNVVNAMNKSLDYYKNNFDIVKYEKKWNVEMILFKRRTTQ